MQERLEELQRYYHEVLAADSSDDDGYPPTVEFPLGASEEAADGPSFLPVPEIRVVNNRVVYVTENKPQRQRSSKSARRRRNDQV